MLQPPTGHNVASGRADVGGRPTPIGHVAPHHVQAPHPFKAEVVRSKLRLQRNRESGSYGSIGL